jgi:hypothetical protein
VVVTVLGVLVMEMSLHEIVDVVAVRNRVMSARCAVRMARVVSGARMGRRAAGRICLTRAEHVLVDVSLVDVMQVPVVQIILVVFVFDGLVPAAGSMLMLVPLVNLVLGLHRCLLSLLGSSLA